MVYYQGAAEGEAAMPIHDWTRVESGIFHDFHHEWISEIKRSLNRGLLPADFYALAEQIAGGLGPDVLALERPDGIADGDEVAPGNGSVAVATAPPKVAYHSAVDIDPYAEKAKAVVIRHCSGHEVVAVLEIVSPGNKGSRFAIDQFVEKALQFLAAGIHLLIVDLFPPGPRDPKGIHNAIWSRVSDDEFAPPPDKPLTVAAYRAAQVREAFVEPVAVGGELPEMPLYFTPGQYVRTPLAATYQSAWEAVPAYWRNAIESGA